MILLATDLDRTLFPNGSQPDDGGLERLKQALEAGEFTLAYVTGRNLEMIQTGILEFDPPLAAYAIGMVGTRIWRQTEGEFHEDLGWQARIAEQTTGWDLSVFRGTFNAIDELRLQEDEVQNPFKLSYYLDDTARAGDLLPKLKDTLTNLCPDAVLVYSEDETRGLGLLDILPVHATKMTALEYLRESLGLGKHQVVYAGDSGNDLLPLTFGYQSILVRNATDEVRTSVVQEAETNGTISALYLAHGDDTESGYYASGILEGLKHFKLI